MNYASKWIGLALAFLGLLAWASGRARADLILTNAGLAEGLSLTTFASGFPNDSGVGPLGTGFASDGTVLVSDKSGDMYRFPSDSDGQVANPSLITAGFGSNNAVDIAQIGGNFYMTRQSTGDLVQLNQDGTLNQVIVGGMTFATGLVADPATGKLFVSTAFNGVIYEVDPVAKTKSVFASASVDGLSLSPDGSVLYGAADGGALNGHIVGFNTTTKAQVYDSGYIPGNIDGTAVGVGPIFGGTIFANTNGGQVYQVNLTTNAQTLIADHGSRGDFVTVDPSTDTLLITQTDRIDRLSGASFVSPVPEPSTYALLVVFGVAGLGGAWVRRKR